MVVNRRFSCDLCPSMWVSERSALQTLHKASSKAREQNYFQGGPTHDWVNYYEQHIESDRSCLNEWHAMDSLESRRPPSPDSVRTKPRERDETEKVIRSTLKEIMMSVDLDEVTSKYIRNRLEEDLDMDLGEFKSFIDQEMLTILGQMDAPTEIFEHVYLGSEWNASNLEELQKNGVGHILNVTREIDNFFPGMFNYSNIRVYDDEKTDLLKYWDDTFKYISKAKKEGSKVLVHCKMGVSRSASVVIAYAMKAYNWDFHQALKHVKEKRNCIKPNKSFIAQLETYQGILDAMKNKEKLQRSKSDTNLKSPELVSKSEKRAITSNESNALVPSEKRDQILQNISGHDLRMIGVRPKSWSPDVENNIFQERSSAPIFLSLENLSKNSSQDSLSMNLHTSPEVRRKSNSCPLENARNVLMPLNNGQSYSVSPNQIVHICKKRNESIKPLVKHRITELGLQSVGSGVKKVAKDKKSLVLNLTTHFENGKSVSPALEQEVESVVLSKEELIPPMLTAKLVKKEIWDPGEPKPTVVYNTNIPSLENCDSVRSGKDSVVWTSSTVVKQSTNSVGKSVENSKLCDTPEVFTNKKVIARKEGDLFSSQLDKVFDREERKQQRNSLISVPPPQQQVNVIEPSEEIVRECPSRQSSWSSYDSAVVLGYQGETREAPSRHSSWGSGDTRTLPSRNSSWGSYDMKPNNFTNPTDKIEKTLPTPELVEGSSGMFSYDRDDLPWYLGTVKRTKQKLEGPKRCVEAIESTNSTIQPQKSPSSETLTSDYSISEGLAHYRSSPNLTDTKHKTSSEPPFVSSNAISKEIDIISNKYTRLTAGSRLSVSAPENSTLSLIPSVPLSSSSESNVSSIEKRTSKSFHSRFTSSKYSSFVQKHRNYLENLQKGLLKRNSLLENSDSDTNTTTSKSGIVKNLKKEFEAKNDSDNSRLKFKGNSLPSSPINSEDSKEPAEDISVKELVGKYEIGTNRNNKSSSRYLHENKIFSNNQNRNIRFSCIEDKVQTSMLIAPSIFQRDCENVSKRPSMSSAGPLPSVVMATVVKAASKKQKHNKKEPHTCLNLKPRNNNPVYNTM